MNMGFNLLITEGGFVILTTICFMKFGSCGKAFGVGFAKGRVVHKVGSWFSISRRDYFGQEDC